MKNNNNMTHRHPHTHKYIFLIRKRLLSFISIFFPPSSLSSSSQMKIAHAEKNDMIKLFSGALCMEECLVKHHIRTIAVIIMIYIPHNNNIIIMFISFSKKFICVPRLDGGIQISSGMKTLFFPS